MKFQNYPSEGVKELFFELGFAYSPSQSHSQHRLSTFKTDPAP